MGLQSERLREKKKPTLCKNKLFFDAVWCCDCSIITHKYGLASCETVGAWKDNENRVCEFILIFKMRSFRGLRTDILTHGTVASGLRQTTPTYQTTLLAVYTNGVYKRRLSYIMVPFLHFQSCSSGRRLIEPVIVLPFNPSMVTPCCGRTRFSLSARIESTTRFRFIWLQVWCWTRCKASQWNWESRSHFTRPSVRCNFKFDRRVP